MPFLKETITAYTFSHSIPLYLVEFLHWDLRLVCSPVWLGRLSSQAVLAPALCRWGLLGLRCHICDMTKEVSCINGRSKNQILWLQVHSSVIVATWVFTTTFQVLPVPSWVLGRQCIRSLSSPAKLRNNRKMSQRDSHTLRMQMETWAVFLMSTGELGFRLVLHPWP